MKHRCCIYERRYIYYKKIKSNHVLLPSLVRLFLSSLSIHFRVWAGYHIPERDRSCPRARFQADTEISKEQLPQHQCRINERRHSVANKIKAITCFLCHWWSPFPYNSSISDEHSTALFLWRWVWTLENNYHQKQSSHQSWWGGDSCQHWRVLTIRDAWTIK